MPNIPTGIDNELLGKIGQGFNIPQGGAEAFGRAGQHVSQQLRYFGEAAGEVANTIEKHNQLQETSAINDGAGDIELQARDGWKKAVANDPQTDPTDFFNQNVAPQFDKLAEGATTDESRAHLAELRTRLHVGLLTEWGAERGKIDSDNAVNSADGAYRDAANAVIDDPASLPMQMANARAKSVALFKAAGVPIDLHDPHFKAQDDQLAYLAADSVAHQAETRNATPEQIEAARQLVNDPKGSIYQALDPAKRRLINDRLDQASITAGNIQAAVQDVQRPILLDKVRQGDPTAYTTLTQMANNPKGTTAQEKAVYQAEVVQQRDQAQAFYDGSKTIYNMSQGDARNLIEGMPPEGARTEDQKGIVAAYKDREEGLNKDPVGWVSAHNATAADAYSQWQQNPTADNWARLAIVQTAIQTKLRPNEPVHLLTPEIKAQAQDIVRSITQTPEGAAGASKQLYGMAQQFGGSWHSIAHDLMNEGVLSREQYTAARLYGDPARQGTAERILTASAMKAGDRFDMKAIPEAQARKAAQTALSGFGATLGNVSDRADVLAGFTDALTHDLQVNGDPNNLPAYATAEAQKMLLSEYSFAGAQHTIRVPASIDSDMVTASSEQALANIDKHDLVIPISHSGLNPDNQEQNYKKTIALTGRWYTNEDGSGIKLYDQDMHNVMERKNGRAVPVQMTWADLQKANAKASISAPSMPGHDQLQALP